MLNCGEARSLVTLLYGVVLNTNMPGINRKVRYLKVKYRTEQDKATPGTFGYALLFFVYLAQKCLKAMIVKCSSICR